MEIDRLHSKFHQQEDREQYTGSQQVKGDLRAPAGLGIGIAFPPPGGAHEKGEPEDGRHQSCDADGIDPVAQGVDDGDQTICKVVDVFFRETVCQMDGDVCGYHTVRVVPGPVLSGIVAEIVDGLVISLDDEPLVGKAVLGGGSRAALAITPPAAGSVGKPHLRLSDVPLVQIPYDPLLASSLVPQKIQKGFGVCHGQIMKGAVAVLPFRGGVQLLLHHDDGGHGRADCQRRHNNHHDESQNLQAGAVGQWRFPGFLNGARGFSGREVCLRWLYCLGICAGLLFFLQGSSDRRANDFLRQRALLFRPTFPLRKQIHSRTPFSIL